MASVVMLMVDEAGHEGLMQLLRARGGARPDGDAGGHETSIPSCSANTLGHGKDSPWYGDLQNDMFVVAGICLGLGEGVVLTRITPPPERHGVRLGHEAR